MSSSKLSIGSPVFLRTYGLGRYHRLRDAELFLHREAARDVDARGIRFPVQHLEVVGIARAAERTRHDVVDLPAEGRMAVAEIGVADQVAEGVLPELPGVGLAGD